jgi:hypothetical protein
MRRKILKRKHVVRGKANDPVRIDSSGKVATRAEGWLQSFRSLIIRNNHDDHLLGGTG